MTYRGVMLGRERHMFEDQYLCGRCGLEGRSRKSRLRDENGRRRPAYCRDCTPIVQREERERQQAAS